MTQAIVLAFMLVAGVKAEDAIRKITSDYEAAFNKGDAKGEAALYAENGDLIETDGRVQRGRTEIEKSSAEAYAGVFKGAHITITPTHTRIVDSDLAISDGSYEI